MLPKKGASNIVSIRAAETTVPDPPSPGNTARPHLIERVEADGGKSPFLACTRRDIFRAFLLGSTERRLADRYGDGRVRVGRESIEAAIRETAAEERRARLEAERRLRIMERLAA